MKNVGKILILVLLSLVALNSCVMDTVNSLCIRNCTKDTLFLELTEVDTLGKGIYWSKDNKDICRLIFPEDTTGVCIHGEKVFLWLPYRTMPDTISFYAPLFTLMEKDTCYIYAIKWQVATQYSIEEICAKKLYDRRVVTKKDFHDGIYEYRYRNSKEND